MLLQLVQPSEAPLTSTVTEAHDDDDDDDVIKLVVAQTGMCPTPRGTKRAAKAPRTPKMPTPGPKNPNQQSRFGRKSKKSTPRKKHAHKKGHESALLKTPPTHLIETVSMEPSPSPHLKEDDHRRTFWASPTSKGAPGPTFAEVVARGTLTMADVA